MVENQDFWLNQVVFSDLVLFSLGGMLLEYAKDCHLWGGTDEAYSALTLANKICDKHKLAVAGSEQGLRYHEETLPRYWDVSVGICSQTNKQEECMASFNKIVQYEQDNGGPGTYSQIASLAQQRQAVGGTDVSNEEDEVVTFAILKTALAGMVQGPEAKAQNRKTHCTTCGKKSTDDLDRCSKCKTVYYCGRKCQKIDWKEHKRECTTSNQSET